MGATVTVNKLAAAFVADNAMVVYVLFEETYEKNCYPHTPHWSCIHMGDIQSTLDRVFKAASCCEGGDLQGRAGNIKPENYVAGWLDELSNPMIFEDKVVSLEIGNRFNASIPEAKAEAVLAKLDELGKSEITDRLRNKERVILSLYNNANLLLSIYGKILPAWHVISNSMRPHTSVRKPDLGHHPEKARNKALSTPEILKFGDQFRLMKKPNGTWFYAGNTWSVVGNYVSTLGNVELNEPGLSRARIKAFRQAVMDAPEIPKGTRISVDLSVQFEYPYQKRYIESALSKIQVTETEVGFMMDVPDDPKVLWEISHFPVECTTWLIPEEFVQETAGQVDLFADEGAA